MKIFFALFIAVFVSSCGSAQTSATTKPCDLSALKIKEVKIEGYREGFVSRSIKSELYKHGARVDQGGVEIIGSVMWSGAGGSPLELSVEVVSMAFASTARNRRPLLGMVHGSEQMAQDVADDFCQSSSAASPTLSEK